MYLVKEFWISFWILLWIRVYTFPKIDALIIHVSVMSFFFRRMPCSINSEIFMHKENHYNRTPLFNTSKYIMFKSACTCTTWVQPLPLHVYVYVYVYVQARIFDASQVARNWTFMTNDITLTHIFLMPHGFGLRNGIKIWNSELKLGKMSIYDHHVVFISFEVVVSIISLCLF